MPFKASWKVSKGSKTAVRGADCDTHVDNFDTRVEDVDTKADKVDLSVDKVDTNRVEFETKAAAETEGEGARMAPGQPPGRQRSESTQRAIRIMVRFTVCDVVMSK
jgi:hypothetical protein